MVKEQIELPKIPYFAGNWSNLMEKWLRDVRDSWTSDHPCPFQEWLALNTLYLCRSWECVDKPYRVRDIVNEFITDPMLLDIAADTIAAWSRHTKKS